MVVDIMPGRVLERVSPTTGHLPHVTRKKKSPGCTICQALEETGIAGGSICGQASRIVLKDPKRLGQRSCR